jgi:replicative DNA helicase
MEDMKMNLSITHQQAYEAERAVLGAVLISQKAADEVIHLLMPRDFSNDAHELIWKAIMFLYKKNRPVDTVTTTEVLNAGKKLELVGGVSYLFNLAESVPFAANVVHYAQIVRSRSYRKKAYEAAQRIMELAIDDDSEDDDFIQTIEREILSVRPDFSSEMKHVSETREQYFKFLSEKQDFIYSGMPQFDEWMGGYGRGWLIVRAGRPSVGKTAKILQDAIHIARQNVGEVLIWSQEMSRDQLKNRIMPCMTKVNSNRLRRKEFDSSELEKVIKGYDEFEKLPLHISDSSGITIEEVRATARQMKRRHGKIGAIIVDYLTIMKIAVQKGENKSSAVGYVTRTAKQIAREMDCPFFMLAQLNREGVGEPKLENLRDSGEIEQDADVVEFLWEDPKETNTQGTVVQCTVAKGRDVGVNQFKYLFKKWIQTFEEM